MIKKLKYVVLVLALLINSNVYAQGTCDYSEKAKLNSEVANIKFKYEAASKEMDIGDYIPNDKLPTPTISYLKIIILNLNEDFYIEATDTITNDKITIKYSDTNDGVYSYDDINVDKLNKITFEIYASSKTNCYGEKIKTKSLSLPRKNEWHFTADCEENKDLSYCDEYVFTKEINKKDIADSISEKNIDKKDKKDKKDINEKEKTVKRNTIITTTAVILIIGGGLVIAYRRRKK